MFEYFPGNYIWSFGVTAALNSGGAIDEVDRACRPIRELAQQGSDVGTQEFMASWRRVADEVAEQAAEAEKAGHRRTAGQKYLRAAGYVCQAERMLSNSSPDRVPTYQHLLTLMERTFGLIDPATTRVVVPFEGTTLPAYFTNASRDGEPVPVVVMWNGLDSTKEHMYTSGWPAELAARGISVLQVDCPGSGEALRLQGLTARVETEDWARACLDYLARRGDVRQDRIGLVGWSLGGYYVPRAAAYEKRLALAVAWGANHNWGEVQRKRLEREGENPVPHYWEHVLWVWGQPDIPTFVEYAGRIHLDGVVEQITCPLLITHGEGDRQISVDYARRSYEQAVGSPKRELRVFTSDEGGTEHIGMDHLPHVGAYTADWIEDTFAELDAGTLQPQRGPQRAAATRTRRGTMNTERPERYAKQLAGHWARKGSAGVEDGATVIRFGTGQVVVLRCEPGVLRIEASVPEGGDPDRFAQVVADHLQRFSTRERLQVEWS